MGENQVQQDFTARALNMITAASELWLISKAEKTTRLLQMR